LTNNGGLNVPAGASLTINGSGSNGSGGPGSGLTGNLGVVTLGGAGTTVILSGNNLLNNEELTIAAGASLTIDGGSSGTGLTGDLCVVTLAGAGSTAILSGNNLTNNLGLTVPVGASLTVYGSTSNGSGGPGTGITGNLGAVTIAGAGSTLRIGGVYTVNDSIVVPGGANVELDGSWTNTAAISVTGGTLNLGNGQGSWTNSGTISATNSTVNLAGTFTLGNFSTAGGTVYVTGTLENTGEELSISAAAGSWILSGGTIDGGTVTAASGALLSIDQNGATIDGVTLDGDVSSTGTIFLLGDLTLNGTLTEADTNELGLYWEGGSQSLSGTGQVVLDGPVVLGKPVNQIMELGYASPSVLTVGPNITIDGQGTISPAGSSADILINQGTIQVPVVGIAALTNSGRLSLPNLSQSSLQGDLTVNGSGGLALPSGAALQVGGNLLGNTTDAAGYAPSGTIVFGSGTHLLEAMSADRGPAAGAFLNNFAYGTLQLTAGADVKLVDDSINSGGGPEAVYVSQLVVPAGTVLDLGGLHMYAAAAQLGGSVVNGSVVVLSSSGAIQAGSQVLGDLNSAGEIDDWTSYGRAGQGIKFAVDPGGGSGATFSPAIGQVTVQVLDPLGQLLASGTSSGVGQIVALGNLALAATGNYTIRIEAPASQPTATGDYLVAAYDSTPNVRSLTVGDQEAGDLFNPYSLDQWTFTALAGQQVQLHVVGATSPAIQFSLTGPAGYTAFSGQTSDACQITLPAGGAYTLAVTAAGGTSGSYAFALQSAPLSLTLGSSYSGTLVGNNQTELFELPVAQSQPLSVMLTDSSRGDVNELYARQGAPPTPGEVFQHRGHGHARPTVDPGIVGGG
jgi:hypothetical protein